jgi:predicted GNAT superfamily acetyltransferase
MLIPFMSISIQPVKSVEECRLIEQLQLKIWNSSEQEVVPDHLLWTMAKEGGVVLLARTESGQPIGFAYGFIGLTEDKRPKLASHQAGVLPSCQSQGWGYQLKLAQREVALAWGLDLITWTFDPLQGRNARFNLHKLGAVGSTYLRDLYGSMRDELNRGLPTDRFKVEWWLTSEHVISRVNNAGSEPWPLASNCPLINPARLEGGLPVPPTSFDLPPTKCCLVEIPDDIQYLKEVDPDLAIRWRLHTREIFETLFDQGFTAIDLLRRQSPSGEGRNYYLLHKDWLNR